jgi:hypothetical protein
MRFSSLLFVSLTIAPGLAMAQQPGPIDRVKITDNELSCAQIHGEIGQMEKIQAESSTAADKSKTSATAASAAGTAAEIAGRTGLFGALGGVTGALFGQVTTQTAAGAVQQTSAQSAQQAAERSKQAQARKEHLTSIFLAKDCKASDLNAPGKPLSGAEMQKIAASAPAAADANDGATPPPGDSQGAKELVEKMAANARGGVPTDVSLGMPMGTNLKSLVGQKPKVVVAGYRVAFVVRNSATAYAGAGLSNLGQSTGFNRTITQAQNKSVEVGLQNVNMPLMQAIADRLYADFIEQLRTQGKDIVPIEEIAASPHFQKIIRAKEPNNYTVSPSGDARHFIIVAPTGVPLYFFHGDPLGDQGIFAQDNMKALMAYSFESNVIPVTAQVVIDFAAVSSSGRSNYGRNAEVGAQPAISLAPFHSTVAAFHQTNKIAGEMGMLRVEKPVVVSGSYATEKTVENFDTAGLANALTRISGTQGVQRFVEKKAYVADPSKFSELALRTGFAANRAYSGTIGGKL